MPKTCEQCGASFPFLLSVDGKTRNLKNRRRCTRCSPFGEKLRTGLAHRRPRKRTLGLAKGQCLGCLRSLAPEDFYLNSDQKPFPRCKECMRTEVTRRARNLKVQAVAYKGGVCIDCGKMPHVAAMSFHHREPDKKDFEIGTRKGLKFENIQKELDKCDLLCRNCHAVRHFDTDFGTIAQLVAASDS